VFLFSIFACTALYTDLSHFLQGKGEFTMEYKERSPVSQDVQMQLVNTYMASKGAE
jgi:elongation factor G